MNKEVFITGNEAVVKACKKAQASIMCGYPITPATEILQLWTKEVEKKRKLKVIQSEDETSAGFNTIGAIVGGERAFTATAGPGHVLMQDPVVMAEAMRLPFVGIIMQRGGPSTGTVVYGQQEVSMACFGGNGEGHRIVYSTSDPQELYDYTLRAFYVAWKYNFPTFVLSDGYQAKFSDSVRLHNNFKIAEKKPIFTTERLNIRNCFNFESELSEQLSQDHFDFLKIVDKVSDFEEYMMNDAEDIIVCHGIVSKSVKQAIDKMRSNNKKVGMLRPVTVWPINEKDFSDKVLRAKRVFIVESSFGHFSRIIKSIIGTLVKIEHLYKPAQLIEVSEIINLLKR